MTGKERRERAMRAAGRQAEKLWWQYYKVEERWTAAKNAMIEAGEWEAWCAERGLSENHDFGDLGA